MALLWTVAVGLLSACRVEATIAVLPTNATQAVVYADRPAAFGPSLPPVNRSVAIPPPYVLPPDFAHSDSGLLGILWPVDHLDTLINTDDNHITNNHINDNQINDNQINDNHINDIDNNHIKIDIHDTAAASLPRSAARQKGCSQVRPPNVDVPWIALVERGGCAFVDKVRAMQRSGAAAVVVGDDTPVGQLVTMYSSLPADDISIPSVFIARLEYRDLYLQALTVLADRETPAPGEHLFILMVPTPVSSFSVFDIVILSVIAPVVLVIFVYAVYHLRRYRQRAHRLMQLANNSPNTVLFEPLTRVDLDVLAPTRTSVPANSFDAQECPVCLDALLQDDDESQNVTMNILRVIQACRHVFHAVCLEKWLLHDAPQQTHYAMCPVCKHELQPLANRCLERASQSAPVEEEAVDVADTRRVPAEPVEDVAVPLLVTTVSPDDSITTASAAALREETRWSWWRRLLGRS